MKRAVTRNRVAMALVLAALSSVAALARAADRSDAQILKELDALVAPTLDASKRQNPTYMRRHLSKIREVGSKRDALILKLYKIAPKHERVPELMGERWGRKDELSTAMSREIDATLAIDQSPKLKAEGVFVKARSKLRGSRSGTPDLKLVEEFLKLAPQDPRGATLLESALERTRAEKAKSALADRLVKAFPDSSYAVKKRQPRESNESIGRTFELEFVDAVTGFPVSIKKLKGKVVVVDFWATWCGPCVAEMPKMKQLYAKYRDQGVEFIGVSLDQPEQQGGLDKLKTFVKENEIAWPQYYQGNGWESAFSKSWGINSIPRVFVVAPSGKLYSVDARGKLDTMIPDLLQSGTESAGGGD